MLKSSSPKFNYYFFNEKDLSKQTCVQKEEEGDRERSLKRDGGYSWPVTEGVVRCDVPEQV